MRISRYFCCLGCFGFVFIFLLCLVLAFGRSRFLATFLVAFVGFVLTLATLVILVILVNSGHRMTRKIAQIAISFCLTEAMIGFLRTVHAPAIAASSPPCRLCGDIFRGWVSPW